MTEDESVGETPIEILDQEVDDSADGGTGAGPLIGVGIVVALAFAAVSWLLGSVFTGDEPGAADEPEQGDPAPLDEPVALGESAGDLTVSASTLDGESVIISATTSEGGAAPWVALEICDADPAGCAPIWTRSIRQVDDTYTAEIELPGVFVSPGGFAHDCRAGGCSLRVITDVRSVVFELSEDAPFVDVGAAGTESMGEASVALSSQTRGRVTVRVDGAAHADFVVRACPESALQCPQVGRGRTDETGTATLDLALPREMAVRLAGAPEAWRRVHCAAEPCVVRVEGDAGEGAHRFDVVPPASVPPTVAVEPESVRPGELITVTGSAFPVLTPERSTAAAWVLCETLPTDLDEIPASCGTPRIVRTPVIASTGDFRMTVPAPDPVVTRTWIGNRPLACAGRCWLVVLAGPFPAVVAAPISLVDA
ncbi:MAG: hypothetical protein DHS20C19_11970 [Acidimicrobiales bacterium]|nr:MAG: hypothetical protein DHS20C19_11970 [Acidimicrobiales bacterium]